MFAWLAIGVLGVVYVFVSHIEKRPFSAFIQFVAIMLIWIFLMGNESSTGLSIHAKWMALGLLLSALGVLFFVVLHRRYKVGVAFFVLASLCYSEAFWLQVSGELRLWLPSMLYAAIVIVFFMGLPRLAAIVLPVAILGISLVQMTWAAAEVWIQSNTTTALYGCLGASLFLLSCIVRAFLFKARLARRGGLLVEGSYFYSQALIVASVFGLSA